MSRLEENIIVNPEEKDNLITWLTCIQQKFDETARWTASISRLTANSRDATEACIAAVAHNTLSTTDAVANAAGLLDAAYDSIEAVNAELTRGITAGRRRRDIESSEEIESTTTVAAEPAIVTIPLPAESYRRITDLILRAVLDVVFWKICDDSEESTIFSAVLWFVLTGHEQGLVPIRWLYRAWTSFVANYGTSAIACVLLLVVGSMFER